MPKAEKGTPKDIAKRIKAKGLQKLKFFCQMCEKQCRDANGFKCHIQSDSHLRQMKIFSENAGGILDQYSREFEKVFLDNLRMRHSTATVNANNVYQEVIQDKQHIHMNATIWASLTDFVKYLGKTGKCTVQETERGWYITYVDRDVAKFARDELLKRRQEAEKAAEQAEQERIERQRIAAAQAMDMTGPVQATTIEQVGKPIKVSIKKEATTKTKTSKPSVFGEDDNDDEDDEEALVGGEPAENSKNVLARKPPLVPTADKVSKKRVHSAGKEEKDGFYTKRAKTDVWLYRDIIVRIVNKHLSNGQYFKRKAVVDRVDDYTAEVTVLDSSPEVYDGGDVIRLDQDDLETVVPKQTGKKVRILKGEYRGKKATVLDLNKEKYRAVLELSDGTVLKRVDYDDFSKLA